jgi:hypothetical protein
MIYELFLLHYGSSSNIKIYFATSKHEHLKWIVKRPRDFTWKLKFMALFQRLEYFCHARGISPWCTHKSMGN